MVKVGFVVILVFFGIIYGIIYGDGCCRIIWEKYGDDGGMFGDIVLVFVFVLYLYGGFE